MSYREVIPLLPEAVFDHNYRGLCGTALQVAKSGR